ncbi:MAG: hypothetical protein ABIP64_14600 [Burkholderiales bacterium]
MIKILRGKSLIGALVAATIAFAIPSAQAATACTVDSLTVFMAQCFDANMALSDYQKKGQAEIIEGRFCNHGGLIADGYLICLGHSLDAVRLGAECWRDTYMKVAKSLIPEDDPRKPQQCGKYQRF